MNLFFFVCLKNQFNFFPSLLFIKLFCKKEIIYYLKKFIIFKNINKFLFKK